MLTSQTRFLLLQMGRRSLWMWVCAGRRSMPGLRGQTERAYDRMAERVPWPDAEVNRVVLVSVVLPIAALYAALRERGQTEREAADAVTRAALALIAAPERRVMWLLTRTGAGRRLFMRGVARLVDLVPTPPWEKTWVERSESRVAFDVTRCYAWETFRLLEVAPAAVAVCADDDAVCSGLCPQLRWSRTGTLATGANRCDFSWELLRPSAGAV